jgi:hypothetical protein
MQLKSMKAEKDANGTKYVNVILTEMDIQLLHGDIAFMIEKAELSGSKQNDDDKRKKIFDIIDQAFQILRPS